MSLRTRITAVAVLAALLVSISLIITSRIIQDQIESRFSEATTTGKTVLWKKIIAGQLDSMVPGASSLARDRATRKALKAGDTQALAESATTTFNLLSASEVLNRMQITDLEGRVQFSAPVSFVGKTRKKLVTKALVDGKIVKGVELDDDGRLVAVVAFPLYTRGKPLGVGVFARDLRKAIDDFKFNDESEVFIVNESGQIDADTSKDLWGRLDVNLPILGESMLDVAHANDAVYSVATLPVLDSEGKAIAHFVSVKDYTESFNNQRSLTITSYSVIVVIISIVIFFIYWYMNRTLKPLQGVALSLKQIADGDLTGSIEVTSDDEIGDLQQAMKSTLESLHFLVGQVNDMTGHISSAADEMAFAIDESSKGAYQQLSEVGQVATAMNEMTATVQEVSNNAKEAAQAASDAEAEAKNGSNIVQQAIKSIDTLASEVGKSTTVIHKVKDDSVSIGTILDVIRGIAEQTNLLALNAAIEAARAGEQGRGFAVVADEVRTLASRTQQSTQEIQEMIEILQQGTQEAVNVMEVSRDHANATVDQAALAGSSLNEITKSVTTINDMNLQISNAAHEQSIVSEEINQNIVSISVVAETGSDRMKSTSDVTVKLSQYAAGLKETVDKFKV